MALLLPRHGRRGHGAVTAQPRSRAVLAEMRAVLDDRSGVMLRDREESIHGAQ